MENDVGVIRISKHPRWSPSPVDLSVSNPLNSSSPAIANQSTNSHPLAASHTLSGLGSPLNGLSAALAPHQLSALGTLNSQLNLGSLPGLTLNSLSSLTANTSSTGPLLSSYSAGKNALSTGNSMISNATQASHLSPGPIFSSRKQREFIPDNKKDDSYWDRRRRNNEAAKRSREKRRISDMVLETRVLELTRENTILKSELYAIKDKFGLPQNAQFGENENSLMGMSDNRGRRDKIIKTLMSSGNENILNLHPQLNASSSANSMISALNGASNSLLHTIGNGFGGSQSQISHNSSQNSSLNGCGSNGRNYMSCSPHSTSSDTSTSPQLNVNNTSLNSNTSANSSSVCTNNSSNSANNSTNNGSSNRILSINKNMNNTDRSDERNALSLELGLSAKNSLSAFYSNGQSLLNHSLIAAYHEQNGRRNSSDHEEENNINNLNSLIANQNESTSSKLEQNGTMMAGLELMDKCRLNGHFNDDKFAHLGINPKQTLSEQDCAALSATLKNFEENLAQNSLPFKLRHKTRTSPNTTDHTSDASSEDSPSSNEQQSNTSRKSDTAGHKSSTKEHCEQSDEEDEFIEVEECDESDEESKRVSKDRKDSFNRNSFSSSESDKFQRAIDSSKKFSNQSTLNLFRNLASMPSGRSTITAFTPYALNCQLNNALQYADQ